MSALGPPPAPPAPSRPLGPMIPAKSFSFNYSNSLQSADQNPRLRSQEPSVRFLCAARGTYPKPELKLFLIKGGRRRPVGEAGVRTFTRATAEGLFEVVLHADMAESQLSSLADLFECVLEIPYSNYAQTRRLSLAQELTWGAYGFSRASTMSILSLFCIVMSLSIYSICIPD
ncbi:hypothetical protein HPB49_016079 [Dermacentor silvarum]|uniref:Uncharacterized protein n=1 Tax=Dermacentor silvarum TaxID=543639 RepID=A0ACB8CLW9_DERSI|nr:hypothetical protein HPB49_016079 [Dermacentor silvarum]